MEIKKAKERFYTTYEKLREGVVFKIDDGSNNIFMKVNDEQGVCLNNPEIVHFYENDIVREIKAELRLMGD